MHFDQSRSVGVIVSLFYAQSVPVLVSEMGDSGGATESGGAVRVATMRRQRAVCRRVPMSLTSSILTMRYAK